MLGKNTWVIPDGFLPVQSTGEQVSHEAVCVLNLMKEEARIRLIFYFEDRGPFEGFEVTCAGHRTKHIRLDKIVSEAGQHLPRGVPYAIQIESDVPIVVQHTRLDSSQEALALFTTMAYSE